MFNVEHMDQKLAQSATYGGAVTGIGSGLTFNEIGVAAGIVIALAGFALQVFFGWRRDRRERELHRLQKDKLDGSD